MGNEIAIRIRARGDFLIDRPRIQILQALLERDRGLGARLGGLRTGGAALWLVAPTRDHADHPVALLAD